MIIDAHVHVLCLDTERYPRHPRPLGSDWWTKGAGDADQLKATLDENGVDKAVVVQSIGVYASDCSCAADTVAGDPVRYALIGAVDIKHPDPAAAVADLATAGATGIRISAIGGDDKSWLSDERVSAIWALADASGLVVVPLGILAEVDALSTLCRRFPAVSVVLDHCGYYERAGASGYETLLRFADIPQVHLKVTPSNLAGADVPPEWLARTAAVFGTDRLCWGSDHPQLQSPSYAEKLRLAKAAAQSLSESDREQFFAATAIRLWWR